MITKSAKKSHQHQQQECAQVLIINDWYVSNYLPVHVQHGLYALLCLHPERQLTAGQCGRQSSVGDRSNSGVPLAAWNS